MSNTFLEAIYYNHCLYNWVKDDWYSASQKADLRKSGKKILIFTNPPSSRKIHFLYRFRKNEKTKNITSFLERMRKNWCFPKYKILPQNGDSEFSAQAIFFCRFQKRPLQKTFLQNISPQIVSSFVIWRNIWRFTFVQSTLTIQKFPSKKKVEKNSFLWDTL